jgi:WD40 repeat protein
MAVGASALTLGQKLGALVVLVVLGAVVCVACFRSSDTDQTPANEATPQPAAAAEALPPRCTVRVGTARYRHGSRIESMSVSADGKLAVTASGFGSFHPALAGKFSPARVFDLTDGRCLYSFPNEGEEYTEAVALSAHGHTLATKDGRCLTFWDARTGKELRKLKYGGAGSRSMTDWMTFTPDGKQLAATLMGSAVQLIDVETATVLRTFERSWAASACAFSPDGKWLATGGYEQENGVYFAQVIEVATGNELRRFSGGTHATANGAKRALAFSPDGTLLAGGGFGEGCLRLWELATGKQPTTFPRLGEEIRSIAFAPDGRTIAAAAEYIYLFDRATGKERLRIERRAGTLAFSPDGLLTAAVRGAIYRWDAASGRQLTPAAAQDSAVEQIAVSADGRRLFTTDQDGDLLLWDPTGTSPRRIAGGVEHGVVASPDRRFLAWADAASHRLRLYDIAAGRIIDGSPIAGETVLAFLSGGKAILTFGGEPPTARLWDVDSGQLQRSFPVAAPSKARLSRTGSEEDRAAPVRLWDVTTGKAGQELGQPVLRLASPGEAGFGRTDHGGLYVPFCTTRRAALSPDGKALAVGRDWAASFGNRRLRSMDGRAFSPDGRFLADWAENPFGPSRMDHVHVWEAATGRPVASLAGGARPGASNAAFAPDGRTLATASADGTVRLWEAATWKVRTEFRGHRDRVTALAFGPDDRLFTGGLDTIVLGWDVRPPREPFKGSLAEAWDALASAEAVAGFQAQGRFLAEPGKAVEWFATRIKPAVYPDPARVKTQLAELDHDDFATRERATAALKEQWPATAAALRGYMAKAATLEGRRRAEAIVREMEQAIMPPESLRALRAAEVLEWIATKEARAVLGELSKGAADDQLTRESAAACQRIAEARRER